MKKNKALVVFCFLCMAAFGFLDNIGGTVIPSIHTELNVTYSDIGLMILIAYMSYLIVTFIGGILLDRVGNKAVLVSGFLMVSTACILFSTVKSFISVVVLMFVLAAGLGCYEICLNSLGAQLFTVNSAVMVNFLHFFYGVGSTIGPKYAGWLLSRKVSWNTVYTYPVLVIIPLFMLLIFVRFPVAQNKSACGRVSLKSLIKDRKIWLFIGILGFTEVFTLGIANWLVNFLQKYYFMDVQRSTFYLSLFFILFTCGRILGGYIAEKYGYIKTMLILSYTIVVLFAMGLLIGVKGSLLISLTGLMVSIIYPTTLTLISKETKYGIGYTMGFVITVSGSINMLISWLTGKLNDCFGLFIGFSSFLFYTILIVVLLLRLRKELQH